MRSIRIGASKKRVNTLKKISEYYDQNNNRVEEWLLETTQERDSIENRLGVKLHGNTFKEIVTKTDMRSIYTILR